jgi:hypothetical protein
MLVTVAICLFRPATMQASGCPLNSANGRIKHVIYIQFDNTHFLRDNPNVPSDLEQMPHLLNFLENNGTVLTNHHTPLISQHRQRHPDFPDRSLSRPPRRAFG